MAVECGRFDGARAAAAVVGLERDVVVIDFFPDTAGPGAEQPADIAAQGSQFNQFRLILGVGDHMSVVRLARVTGKGAMTIHSFFRSEEHTSELSHVKISYAVF